MKKRLRFGFGIVILVAMIFAVWFATMVYYRSYTSHVYADLRRSLEFLIDTGELEMMQRRDYKSSIESYRVTWMDPKGNVFYDNYIQADHVENQGNQKEVLKALGTGAGTARRKTADAEEDFYWFAKRLTDGSVARIGVRSKSMWQLFWEGASSLLVVGGILFAVCLLLGRYFTNRAVAPIAALAKHPGALGEEKIYPEVEPFVREIRQKQEELVRAGKRQEAFTANITHELKTPLAAISGYAQFLETGANSAEEQVHFGQEIRKSADHMLTMVDDVLSLSKLDVLAEGPIETECVDLAEIVSYIVKEREPLAAARQISLVTNGQKVQVQGNRALLRQLAGNLTDNAIRYGREGGCVWLATGLLDKRPYLEVRDNGIGIAAEEQEKIFDRFYRVNKNESRRMGGTGLGLAIAKEIADLHEAKIQVESEPGSGTTMRVVFREEGVSTDVSED